MTARYKMLADVLRQRISSGALAPGRRLPSAAELAWEHDVSRDTALRAMATLRAEGLLFLAPDNSIRVGPCRTRTVRDRTAPSATVVDVPAHAVISARMPTPGERETLALAEGTPVLVVRIGDVEEVHPADRTTLRRAKG
ncbi:GntR family transcriptional regulator [Dactylosporangium roseum]|uniref:GntR family transcriptional regulator n=1 Tax=Dactylosporangium roseum TaxID=47989 RepID=A0ABY5YZF9_9ACTN|nr:GntR family transcriptional regulator [Dactylosporangium roseum]UWZ35141.1 GntR family transcriptional regulator [Dactylosporangium roseum]